ncbi:MAG: peptidylprolyl isomerase, partial [Myxococcota bacterium]|nr:peptidylprolyl isomerase [Myxococcota bacterium]
DRLARIKHNILQRLIEKELIRQAAKKARVTVSHAAVARGLAEYKKRFQTEAQFNNYLKHGRVTLKSIKDRIREKKRLENLLSSRGRLKVTKTEVREFYRANERFYVEKEGVEASHILVKLAEDAPRAEEKRAMKKIEKIQERLRRGSDFAAVAKKLSEGPSAAKGGDLGFFGRGQMVKPFEEAAFRLEVGAVSGPVRTRFGFHIIKVTDTREERKRPLAEVRDQIAQSLTNKKLFKERRKLLDALRQAATIKTKLPTPPSSDDAGVKEISEP